MSSSDFNFKKHWYFIPLFHLLIPVFVWAFMLLWNWLVPELFSGPVISFWQSLGLLVMAKMLFGFGSGKDKSSSKGKNKCKKEKRKKWKEKFENMSTEEKEEFRAMWKENKGKWKREGDADDLQDDSNGEATERIDA